VPTKIIVEATQKGGFYGNARSHGAKFIIFNFNIFQE
jgi:hypothetical protein